MHEQSTDLFTVSGAARLFSELGRPCSAAAVRVWADAGKIPMVKTVNGVRLFRRLDIETLAAERRGAVAAVGA